MTPPETIANLRARMRAQQQQEGARVVIWPCKLAEALLDDVEALLSAREALKRAERALCAARDHDPSCPMINMDGPYDPSIAVEGCTCHAHLVNARIDAAIKLVMEGA